MNKVVATLLLCLILPCSAVAQIKTDREQDRLIGPVKSVRVETARLVSKSERWIEKGRELERIINYDFQGNMAKQTIYRDRPTVTEIDYQYDKDGNRNENITSEGPPGASSSYRAYGSTDRGGATGDGDRRTFSLIRRVFKHDADGNRIEETMYGNRATRGRAISGIFNHVYDQKQQRIETTHSAAGQVINRWAYTYDDKGNVLETAKYTRGDYLLIKESYLYEFDSTGNWIKQTSSKLQDRKRSYFRPEEVTYRKISYY